MTSVNDVSASIAALCFSVTGGFTTSSHAPSSLTPHPRAAHRAIASGALVPSAAATCATLAVVYARAMRSSAR